MAIGFHRLPEDHKNLIEELKPQEKIKKLMKLNYSYDSIAQIVSDCSSITKKEVKRRIYKLNNKG